MSASETEKTPSVLVIGTGGTISSVGSGAFDFLNYPISGMRLSTDELLDELRVAVEGVNVRIASFEPVSSTELGPEFWWRLRAEINAAQARDPDLSGIVILHGTGTLEETAFALDLFVALDIPVVLTGAQRPINAISSDAAYNLWSAIRVAVDPNARDLGVLVVMNGEIHAAREVTKAANFALDAFQSHPTGPVGSVEGTSPVFRRETRATLPRSSWEKPGDWPRVDIVMSYAGADGAQIDAAIAAGARGIVMAGLAPGYATPDQRRALKAAQEVGIVIVMSTRAHVGPTLALDQNGVEGLIGSRCLNPAKARILLAGALISSAEISEIDGMFANFA